VLVATGGGRLAGEDMAHVLMGTLVPLCTVATPNHNELRELYRAAIPNALPEAPIAAMASALRATGCRGVLVTGGDTAQTPWTEDLCFTHAPWPLIHRQRRLKGPFHGSGCTLSSFLAAYLALGHALPEALCRAQQATHAALLAAVKPAQAAQAMPRRIRA
jgi:hydroxymethylpyrimidine/phosphomethylpyrimidine kinase